MNNSADLHVGDMETFPVFDVCTVYLQCVYAEVVR